MNLNYFFCPLCDSGAFHTFRVLYRHLQKVHQSQSLFKVRCELHHSCGSTYSTFESYRRHLYKRHRDLLNEESSPNTTVSITDSLGEEFNTDTSSYDGNNTCVDNDYDDNTENQCGNEDEQEIDIEQFWQTISGTMNRENEEAYTIDAFKKHYTRFLLELRETHLLPQNIVQSISSYLYTLFDILQKIIKNYVMSREESRKTFVKNASSILLAELDEIISILTTSIKETSKSEYAFLKQCERYFDYRSAIEIKLNDRNECAYHLPIRHTLTQMLSKPDVLELVIENFNDLRHRSSKDKDLMFNYRNGNQALQHPVLTRKPDSLLIQLYSDGVGVTNPIGPKRDQHKLTFIYFLLEDLPDEFRSLLQSIGLVGVCYSEYLVDESNRQKFFDSITKDLNSLQSTGLTVRSFNGRLNFAFSTFAGDHLASNDIGGFQKNFNSGNFCRTCHVSYEYRLVSLTDISFRPRTRTTHDQILQKIHQQQNNNRRIMQGVSGESPLSALIGFHPVLSLPNDAMHDFSEGVCPLIVVSMLKEASSKRLLTYNEIERRTTNFAYGYHDSSNKPPPILPKHLAKNYIVGSASQKLCLFRVFPFIFSDVIDRLDTLEIYTCLREIVSIVFAYPCRRSWLPYLKMLTVRFQSLMIHYLPDRTISKVHFVTDYARQIEMFGPATRTWCMRYEAKHRDSKRMATTSLNFKNIPLTLSKRHRLRQCIPLSNEMYYQTHDRVFLTKEIRHDELPVPIRRVLEKNQMQSPLYVQCKTLIYQHVECRTRSIFVLDLDQEEDPEFGLVLFILKIRGNWKFIIEELQTISFNENLWAYQVEETDYLSIVDPGDCVQILPHGLDFYEDHRQSSYVSVLSRLTQ